MRRRPAPDHRPRRRRKPMAVRTICDGERFGKWTVISGGYEPLSRYRIGVWCICGHQTTVAARELLRGASQGCTKCANKKHGQSHDNKSPTYTSWLKMIERCYRANEPMYFRYYQARGIAVCDRWRGPDGFMNFFADMGERPQGRSLDRIDNDGNYEASNCKWSSPKEQANNRRRKPR